MVSIHLEKPGCPPACLWEISPMLPFKVPIQVRLMMDHSHFFMEDHLVIPGFLHLSALGDWRCNVRRTTLKPNLHEPLQLVELEVQLLKALLEKVAHAIVKHDLGQHAECLLFRHLKGRNMKMNASEEVYKNERWKTMKAGKKTTNTNISEETNAS